jgi:hypothetical protein
VITARSLVDASYTEKDGYGEPEIADEQIKVVLPGGGVLRAGRVWIDAGGSDLAALVLDGAPPDLAGTAADRLEFGLGDLSESSLRLAAADGAPLPPLVPPCQPVREALGAVVVAGGKAHAVVVADDHTNLGDGTSSLRTIVRLQRVPADLRPQGP